MDDVSIREPKQKRSIEKKAKIIEAGAELFREKGYHNTNTIEIAKAAGVSTGTVYGYFKDKRDIYLAAYEYLHDTHFQPLLDELVNIPKPIDIKVFVEKWVDGHINFCVASKYAATDWVLMQDTDPEIMRFFAAYEDRFHSSLVSALDSPNISKKNLEERTYLLYSLTDSLGLEYAFRTRSNVSLEILREETVKLLIHLLTKVE